MTTPNAAPGTQADPDTIREMASLLFDHIESQLERADNKAQLILAADTLLAAALTLSGGGGVVSLFGGGLTPKEIVAAAAGLLLFLALIISIFSAILASKPILKTPIRDRNLFFFGHIARFDLDEYTRLFEEQTDAQIREALLAQVYAKSTIAGYKFAWVGRSTNFLIIALLLWAISQMLVIFLP